MTKLLLVVAMLLGVSSAAQAAGKPVVVKSGTVQATVNGQVKTYNAGDTIPAGAAFTATSDAVLTANGTEINVPSGASGQAAVSAIGGVDVRCNSGSITVIASKGGTAVLGAGSEVSTLEAGNGFSQIAGTSEVTVHGVTRTLQKGTADVGINGGGSYVGFLAYTSILPPPPPNPTQNNSIVPLSGSSPG